MVLHYSKLSDIRARHKDQQLVLASGVFDLLHYGHVQYLQSLQQYGDVVVVMVKSDERIRCHKDSSRPIIPEIDRVRMVEAIKGVDYVFVGSYDPQAKAKIDYTYEDALEKLQPDIFVTANDDWEKLRGITKIKIVTLPRFSQAAFDSTTAIVRHISSLGK